MKKTAAGFLFLLVLAAELARPHWRPEEHDALGARWEDKRSAAAAQALVQVHVHMGSAHLG